MLGPFCARVGTTADIGSLADFASRRAARSALRCRREGRLALSMDPDVLTRASSDRFRGWYRVLSSHSLARGAVLTGRLAGRDVVVFRTRRGTVGAVPPFCPHLGAHLGHGGTVEDEHLRCPFHGFRYALDGSCSVPESYRAAPARCQLTPYPVRELLGQIFVFDAEPGRAPDFELPALTLDGLTTPRWLTLRFEGRVEDFAENGVDLGHFAEVHRYRNVRDVEVRYEGPRVHTRFRFDRKNPAGPVPPTITSVFDTVIHGLGCSVTELTVETLGLRLRLLLLASPVEAHRVDFTVGASLRLPEPLARLPRAVTDRATAPLMAFLLQNIAADIEQDRLIWAHRARLPRPALAPEDGEVARFRRYLTELAMDTSEKDRMSA
jgi:nitrite reductase/ring-hydroxylating ferredoxin subunit